MFFGAYNSLLIHASMPEKTLENPVFMLPLCIHYRSCTRRQVYACRFVDHLVYTYTHVPHTHTRTHTHTHTRAHTHIRTHIRTHIHARAHTHKYTNVQILLMWISRRCLLHKCVCMGERESVYVCVCVRAWLCVYMHVRSYMCMNAFVCVCVCEHMHASACTLARAQAWVRAHTHANSFTLSRFFCATHARTHRLVFSEILASLLALSFPHSLFLSRFSLARFSLAHYSLSCSLSRSLALFPPPSNFFLYSCLSLSSKLRWLRLQWALCNGTKSLNEDKTERGQGEE